MNILKEHFCKECVKINKICFSFLPFSALLYHSRGLFGTVMFQSINGCRKEDMTKMCCSIMWLSVLVKLCNILVCFLLLSNNGRYMLPLILRHLQHMDTKGHLSDIQVISYTHKIEKVAITFL